MKVLVASTPASGHINPLLAVARVLMHQGNELVVVSAEPMRELVEATGADFRAFSGVANYDGRKFEEAFPDIVNYAGQDLFLYYMKYTLIDAIAWQHSAIQHVLETFAADIILADDFMFGAFPMLLGPRSRRPPIVMLGTTCPHLDRTDGAPLYYGLPPADDQAQLDEYRSIAARYRHGYGKPIEDHFCARLRQLNVEPPTTNMLDAAVRLPDAYLQLTVPSFAFPCQRPPSSLKFVGALPIGRSQNQLPSWAHELDGERKVVLVTQGTVATRDYTELIIPSLHALAGESDVITVVTTGGRTVDAIPRPVPANVRLATYLPFEWLLPRVDVLVTNGGYATVNSALSSGIPILGSGVSEDKADVNAHIAWSGAGIDLKTSRPSPVAIRTAVRKLLDEPQYSRRAGELAREFACYDTVSEILSTLTDLVAQPV